MHCRERQLNFLRTIRSVYSIWKHPSRLTTRAMELDRNHGCRLGCIALLFTTCLSFQNNLPRIRFPSPGLRWRFPESTSRVSERWRSKSSRRTHHNLFPFEPTSLSSFAINMSNETSDDDDSNSISVNGNEENYFSQNITNNIRIEENNNYIERRRVSYILDISKHYFDEMEDRSGKDYRWIKPLTKPVSQIMMYVDLVGFVWSLVWRECIKSSKQTALGSECVSLSFTHIVLFFSNCSKDIERRKKCYLSDWTDGFKNLKKVIPAVMFLYFACLSPAIR